MMKGKLTCNAAYRKGMIDPHIFGSFVEHMGRVVYTGIYEPDHPTANRDGFREDVLDLVREIGITSVRYPGGNFVSCYNWEDGVGPVELRPRKREMAWRSIETNEVGTNEFMKWVSAANVDTILAVNLGTKGIENAVHYLEYVNLPVGTKYSNLRKEHGFEKPYQVKRWCLGNEMDGTWQIGHKTATEYGRLAVETGKAMKLIDPSIQLIACGSAKSDMPTFPEWDLEVLDHVYEVADYLALHQYYGGQAMGSAAFLAQSEDFDHYIATARGAIQVTKAKKRSRKNMFISVDEWGVWAQAPEDVTQQVDDSPWQIAPAISEQIYTMEDALLFASMLMTIVRNSDIIKIGCQSLLANISACIMTKKGGETWRQTTFYPFMLLSNHARGQVLDTKADIPVYSANGLENVPEVDSLAVLNQDEIAIFFVNRNDQEEAEISVELQSFQPQCITESVVLHSDDKKATNESDHHRVIPVPADNVNLNNQTVTVKLLPLSFCMVRIAI